MKKFSGILILSFLLLHTAFAGAAEDNSGLFSKRGGAQQVFNPPAAESIVYMESSIKIDAVDPEPIEGITNYYPGFRGPNQLIVYTPAYGMHTATNEYGTEAVVVNNTAVSLNGADSAVPYNGFVVSGHGRAKNWIMKNIQAGSKVYIDKDNKMLYCYLTPESLVFAAKEKIKEVNALLEYYRRQDILYNDKKASDYLETAKSLLRKAEKYPEKTQSLIHEALKASDEAMKNAVPYSKSELKGIWVRPLENTPAKIERTVEEMHEAGISDIFLETFFHGTVIYKSGFLEQYGVISQMEEFKGFDPLKIWIEEAHKRGMKVHVWFECFYLGNDNPKDFPNHILSVYPEWSNKRLSDYDAQEPVKSVSEHNGYFLDPANIQTVMFLTGILKEIIEKYKPDGINLDYLRYPQSAVSSYSNYAETNWGYTETARAQFKEMYGIDPVSIQYGSREWDLWALFRQEKISNFARSVKILAEPYNITVTAVIFPDLKKSSETKMQNWKIWAENNYTDGFTPLILTSDKNTAFKIMQKAKSDLGAAKKIYPGIFTPFMNGSFEDLLMLLQKTRELNCAGAVIFDYAHLDDKYKEALKTRIYNSSYENSRNRRAEKKLNKKQLKEKKRLEKEKKKALKAEMKAAEKKKKQKKKN